MTTVLESPSVPRGTGNIQRLVGERTHRIVGCGWYSLLRMTLLTVRGVHFECPEVIMFRSACCVVSTTIYGRLPR